MASSALHGTGDARPPFVGVDDAHLLDEASAALVALLVRSGSAAVVVTLRSGESAPDAIVALWKDNSAPLIALQTLARCRGRHARHLGARRRSRGLDAPRAVGVERRQRVYLRELVLHGLESGALQHRNGLWRWPGPLEPGDRLQDLIAKRMGNVGDDERAALELLAVGQPLTVGCLRRLAVADLAARLERRGLVTSRRQEHLQVALGHPLFGEVLRDRMTSARTDEVKLALADAVEATCEGTAAELFRVALWRVDAGDRTHPEQFRAAARRVLQFWEPAVAERLARAALDAGPEIEAAYVLGEALSDQNRTEEALDVLRTARDLPGPDALRASVAAGEAGVLSHQLGRFADAERVLRETAERVTDPDAWAILEGGRAGNARLRRLLGRRRNRGSHGRGADRRLGRRARAHRGRAPRSGRPRRDRTPRVGDPVGRRVPDDRPVPRPRGRRVAVLLSGRVGEAEQHAEAAYDAAVIEGAEFPRAIWSLARGIAFLVRGLPRSATPALREAAGAFENADRGLPSSRARVPRDGRSARGRYRRGHA